MDVDRTSSPAKRSPSLAQVNLLLLISLVLILGVSILTSQMHFYWTLLIREVVLILGPALLFVLLLRLPWRETLRWPAPGRRALDLRVLGASALIGLGGWLFDTWLGAVFGEILGYTLPLPPDFYPTEPAQALALFGLLAIVAPVCEEVLFRGLIQRGYEQLGVRASIVITGLLFALFHQSLAQGLALIPLAILLSYVAWRTDSLPACILAHAVNNAPAALLIPLSTMLPQLDAMSESAASSELSADLTARLTAISPAICALPVALLGGLLVLGGLWGIRHWCPRPLPQQRGKLKPGWGPWLGRIWPLLIVVPLTLLVMGAEVVMGRFPELSSMGRPVQWALPPWNGPQAWTYEVRNVLDEPVGTIECTLDTQEESLWLTCSREQSAYEADTGRGVYYGGDLQEDLSAHWLRDSLRLWQVERQRQVNSGWRSVTIAPRKTSVDISLTPQEGEKQGFALRVPDRVLHIAGRTLSLGPDRTRIATLLEPGEWPWRFSALPFQGFYSAQAVLIDYDPPQGGDPALTRVSVVVYGSEPIATPAGTFIAWRVEVGPDHVAWYDAQEPHTLVALEDGMEKWVLVSVE
jgi:membrane protease YdiL (CAAX protease family)